MRFASLHKAVTYLIAGLGLFTLTLGSELGLVPTALLVAGYLGSWFVEGPIISRPGYGRFMTWAVVGVFVVQVLRGLAGDPVLALGIEYAGFLQITRLCHRRTARDHQHIAVLAFVHLIAASVLSTGLDFAVCFVGFVVVTPWMLALTHLRGEIEGNYSGAPDGDPRSAADVQRVLASRRVAGPGFLLGTASLAIPLFVVTAALFLIFPRVGMGFLSFGDGPGHRVAGFGRNVELGGFGVIRDDPTVVVRVKVPGLPDPPPETLALRLRGTSFDSYDGRRWTRSAVMGQPVLPSDDYYSLARWPYDTDERWVVLLDPIDEPVLFLPPGAVGVQVPARIRAGRPVARQLVRSEGLDVRYTDQDALGLIYTVYVSPDREQIPDAPPDAEALTRLLQLPDGQEPVAELASSVVGDAVDDETKAHRLLTWLRDSSRFRYSLHQPDTRGRDPLQVFLLEERSGHCEYFSTALAVMLRTQGIAARNVTGFVGGRYNPYGRYYAIRQGDAHSWVEAWIDGRWVTLDPTPPSRDDVGPTEGILSGLGELLDAMRTRWSSHVVGYDLSTQAEVLHDAIAWFDRLTTSEAPGSEEVAEEGEPDGSMGTPSWVLLAVVPLLVGLALLARRLGRATRQGASRADPSVRAALGLYRDLERAMRRRGAPRSAVTTPLEHSRALEASGFIGAEKVDEVTRAYLDARFGGRPIPDARMARLRRLVREVASRP